MQTRSILFLILLFQLFTSASGQMASKIPQQNTVVRKVTFIMGNANDVSSGGQEKWLGALIEAALEFKFRAIGSLGFIPSDQVLTNIPGFGAISAPPTEREFNEVAKKLHVEYLGKVKYELSGNKDVLYYLEIISVKDGSTIATVERGFKIDKLGLEIDIIVNELLKSLKIEPPRELARFLKYPILSDDTKNLRQLGEYLTTQRFSPSQDKTKMIDNYRTLCNKDRAMLLAYWHAGLLFEKSNLYIESIEAFKLINQIFPEYLPAYAPLSRANRGAGRMENALSTIAMGEQRGIKDIDLLLEKAFVFHTMKKMNEAEAMFRGVLSIEPNNPTALLYYARKCNDDGKGSEALELCNRFLKVAKGSAEIFLEIGRSQNILKNADAAIYAFVKSTQLDNQNYIPFVCLGDLYSAAKSYTEASQYYDKALLLSAENVDLYINAAKAFSASGKSQKAFDLLKKIEPKYPDNDKLNRELGLLEFADNDMAKAKVHLENSIRKGTKDERVLSSLGLIYVTNKEFEKALPLLREALPLLSDNTQCKIGLVKIYIGRSEFVTAAKILEELAIQKVNIPGAFKTLADYYYSKADKTRALDYYKKENQQSKKTDATVLTKIAEVSYELGLWQESKTAYLELIKTDYANAAVMYRLALIALHFKDRVSATNYVSKAAALGATDAQTYFLLGQGFSEVDSPKDAAIAFQKCISLDPTNEKSLIQLALLLEKMQKDSAAAEVNLRLFAVNNGKYKDNLVIAARLFESKKLNEQAKHACSLFVMKNYVNPEVNIQLARLEFRSKNYNAIPSLVSTIPASKLDTLALRICVESFFNLQQYQKVITYAAALLQKVPNSLQATELCAISYDKTGAFESAVSMYKKYLSLSGNYQLYAFRIGELYEQMQYQKAAIDYYETVSKTYTKDYRIFDHLARLYYKSKNWNLALPQLKKALSFENAAPELFLLLGRSYAATNNLSGAIEGYAGYLKTNDNDTTVWIEYGVFLFNNNDFKNASVALSNALRNTTGSYQVHKYLGIALVKTGEQTKAIGHLEKALAFQKNDKEVISLLSGCYSTTGDKTALITSLRNMCAVDRNNFDIRRNLGELLIADSKLTEAAIVLEEALLLKKCVVDIDLKLASIYEKIGKPELVGGHLRSALGCDPKNPSISFQVYQYFDARLDTTRALEYLRQTLEFAPTHSDANFKMGQYLLLKNSAPEALVCLTRAVNNNPNPSPSCKLSLAEALYRVNRTEDALTAIRPLVTPECRNPQILQWAGILMKETGRTDTAMQLLERTVQVDSKCGSCYALLGELYFDAGYFDKAITNYQAAIQMNGFTEDYSIRIGRAYAMSGKDVLARQTYESILAKKPQCMEARYRAAHCYLQNGQVELCRNLLQQFSNSNSGWLMLAKGEALEFDGKLESAFKLFQDASALLPDVPELQAGFGRYSLKKNDFNTAIEYFARAMAGDPENCQYMLDMGNAYEGSKNFSTALELYKEVKNRRPDYPGIGILISRIESN
jgi:tetratricopeptide (TPR) repeat protein